MAGTLYLPDDHCAGARIGRLVVCPTPIGNLDDVTLRVLAALAGADRDRLRGHRHTRALLDRHAIATPLAQLSRAQRSRALAELARRIPWGASSRSSPTPAPRSSRTPASSSCARASPRGSPVEVLPGPERRHHRARRLRPARRELAVRRLSPAPRPASELGRCSTATAETLVAFESPRRLAAHARRCSPPSIPSGRPPSAAS